MNEKRKDERMNFGHEVQWVAWLAAFSLSCGSSSTGGSGSGNLSVVLAAEETISDGLDAGSGDENILDGFDVRFNRYIVAIGNVAMSQVGGANPQSSSALAVADFTSLPSTQPEVTAFNGIATGQYTRFGFETPPPSNGVLNVNGVATEDIDAMVANGWSYIIEGTITQVSDGVTKSFLIEADVPTVYSDCALDGMESGVNVAGNSSVDITLHGDHIFFNGFPEEEGNVMRLAQWLWDIEDSDSNELLTRTDFEAATDVGSLFPSPPSGAYELTGGPITPISNAWDFIRAQLGTQGHIFGEGECEWSPL
ncbi:MAG: hypothetical protein HKN97_08200 [Myxococcales bacterium]|nr:hypothetical protein [Myxococcales bacterium]